MGLLSEDQKKEMALAHGKMFEAVCDEEHCGRCIKSGQPYVVLKWGKQKWEGKGPKPFTWNARYPKKIRCMDCNNAIMEYKPKEVKLKAKQKKALAPEEAQKINPLVHSIVMRMLKKSEEPIANETFKNKVFQKAKSKEAKIKKSVVNATLRFMKKAKIILYRKKAWRLPDGTASVRRSKVEGSKETRTRDTQAKPKVNNRRKGSGSRHTSRKNSKKTRNSSRRVRS